MSGPRAFFPLGVDPTLKVLSSGKHTGIAKIIIFAKQAGQHIIALERAISVIENDVEISYRDTPLSLSSMSSIERLHTDLAVTGLSPV